MRFVVKSSNTCQDDTGNVAIVDFDDEDLAHLVEWRALFEELKKKYSIVELSFWFTKCWWFDDCPFGDDDGLLETPFTEEQADVIERQEWLRVDDEFWLGSCENEDEEEEDEETSEGRLKECRTAADRVVVDERGVFCKAHIKYSDDDDVETWLIPWDAIICPIHGVDQKAAATCIRCVAIE